MSQVRWVLGQGSRVSTGVVKDTCGVEGHRAEMGSVMSAVPPCSATYGHVTPW